VDAIRVSGTYVYDNEDEESRCDILPGTSHYDATVESADHDPIGPGITTVHSLTRDSRRSDYTRGTHSFIDPLRSDVVTRATSPTDYSKPKRLKGFYFQWKPLPQPSHEFTKKIQGGSIVHGKLILNCPYIYITGEKRCSDFLSVWDNSGFLGKNLTDFRA